jgi:hypothetical protein
MAVHKSVATTGDVGTGARKYLEDAMPASRSALDPVEPGASRQNALLAYQHFEALPLRGLAQLVGTRVAETPIAIEDVNGVEHRTRSGVIFARRR